MHKPALRFAHQHPLVDRVVPTVSYAYMIFTTVGKKDKNKNSLDGLTHGWAACYYSVLFLFLI